MQTEHRVAANPKTKPIDSGCESAENWQLSSTFTVAIVIITQLVSWYSFYRRTEGGRLSRPSVVCALVPAFYMSLATQQGGSVAEWLACWTQAQKGLGSNRSRDAVE